MTGKQWDRLVNVVIPLNVNAALPSNTTPEVINFRICLGGVLLRKCVQGVHLSFKILIIYSKSFQFPRNVKMSCFFFKFHEFIEVIA